MHFTGLTVGEGGHSGAEVSCVIGAGTGVWGPGTHQHLISSLAFSDGSSESLACWGEVLVVFSLGFGVLSQDLNPQFYQLLTTWAGHLHAPVLGPLQRGVVTRTA